METKPLAGLTSTLRLLLKFNIVVTFIAVFAGLYEYHTYKNLPSGIDPNVDFLPSDASTAIVGLIQLVLYIILAIVFLRWIHRTNKNLNMFSGKQMKFTPGWSIGWYFIPIANLYKPYQAMKEIWIVSHKNDPITFTILGWWWFFWLVSNLLGRLAFKTVMKADDIDSLINSTITYIMSDGIDLALNIIALILVTEIFSAYSRNIIEHLYPAEQTSAR